jgi:hypothetical protein
MELLQIHREWFGFWSQELSAGDPATSRIGTHTRTPPLSTLFKLAAIVYARSKKKISIAHNSVRPPFGL